MLSNLIELITIIFHRYSENAKKRSQLLKDNPVAAQERLVFWVEYVIRHKGAEHLRVAALKLNFFQYFLLDVIAFFFVALILLFVVNRLVVRYLFILVKRLNTKFKKKVQ